MAEVSARPGSRPVSARTNAWPEQQQEASLGDVEVEVEDEGPLVIKGEDDIPKGCWYAFLQSFNGIWSTKDMNDTADREDSVRTTVRELVLYLLFLAVIVVTMFGGTSPYRYQYTNMMKEHLEKFEEVKQESNPKSSDGWETEISFNFFRNRPHFNLRNLKSPMRWDAMLILLEL